MKIMAPVDRVEEVDELIDSGAGELYCGLLWDKWLENYTIAMINRRPASVCNLKSFESLRQLTDKAHKKGVPVGLTVNEHYYLHEQLELLFEYLQRAQDSGVDSIIVSDPALILVLKERGLDIDIQLSTGIPVLNSETALFFREMGVSKVILERHLKIDEIGEIVNNVSGLETCVFIMNSRCPNIDGFCSFQHFQFADPDYQNACKLPYRIVLDHDSSDRLDSGEQEKRAAVVRQKVWERNHMDDVPCGACAIGDFAEMGIGSLKIVGRGNSTRRKLADVKFIRTLLTLLSRKRNDKTDFRKKARLLYKTFYGKQCRTITCYYPEVRDDDISRSAKRRSSITFCKSLDPARGWKTKNRL